MKRGGWEQGRHDRHYSSGKTVSVGVYKDIPINTFILIKKPKAYNSENISGRGVRVKPVKSNKRP